MKRGYKIALATLATLGLLWGIDASAVVTQGFQGGTGISSTNPGNVGSFLQVSGASPFLTYALTPGIAGAGSSPFIPYFTDTSTLGDTVMSFDGVNLQMNGAFIQDGGSLLEMNDGGGGISFSPAAGGDLTIAGDGVRFSNPLIFETSNGNGTLDASNVSTLRTWKLPDEAGNVVISTSTITPGNCGQWLTSLTIIDSGAPCLTNVGNWAGTWQLKNPSDFLSSSTSFNSKINGISGAVTIAGTASQVNVASSSQTITLSTPQNIATSSNVQFSRLSLSTSTTSTASLYVNGNVGFVGSSTVVTPSIGGAIVSGGCDSATSSIDTTVTSSTAAFITTAQNDPGSTLGGTWSYSFLSAPGVLTTRVCANITVTPNSTVYVVKIIK